MKLAVLRRRRRRGAGFTLVELLVAVSLMLMLMVMISFAFNNAAQAMRKAQALVEVHQVAKNVFGRLGKDFLCIVNICANPRSVNTLATAFLGGRPGGAQPTPWATSLPTPTSNPRIGDTRAGWTAIVSFSTDKVQEDHQWQTWSNLWGGRDRITFMRGVPDAPYLEDRRDDLHGKTTNYTDPEGGSETILKDGHLMGTQEVRSRRSEYDEITYWHESGAGTIWMRTNPRWIDAIIGNALEPAPKGGRDMLVGPVWTGNRSDNNTNPVYRRLIRHETRDDVAWANITALKFEYQPYGTDIWLEEWVSYGDLNSNGQYDDGEPKYCARHRPSKDPYPLLGYQDERVIGPGPGTGCPYSDDGGWWGVPGAIRVTVTISDGRGVVEREFIQTFQVMAGGSFPTWIPGTDRGGSDW